VVYLAQESTLQYPEHFATDKREVNLQGEAFFDVAKNREQTFLIETGKVRIEVLGTAFNVRSHEDDSFRLSVQRGRVKVSLKQGGQSVLVNAGETVTLQARQLQLSETGDSDEFRQYTKNIRFKDECLEDILRVVNEAPTLQIQAASSVLNKRKLTIEFENNSPETVAELICWALSLKCSREGDKLILFE
jgi:transmembrane sensor